MTDGQLDPKTGDGESGLEDQKTRNLIPFLFFGMYARSSQVKTCFRRLVKEKIYLDLKAVEARPSN